MKSGQSTCTDLQKSNGTVPLNKLWYQWVNEATYEQHTIKFIYKIITAVLEYHEVTVSCSFRVTNGL